MKFSKWKLVVCLTSLLLSLVILVACNQTKKVGNDKAITDTEESPIFNMEDVKNAVPTNVGEAIDLPGIDLNNEEINIEGAAAPEEDSELETLDNLNGVAGYLTYYRYNGERYHIWTANQATDVKKFVHSTTNAIQSVAVSGDGNWVAASMIESNSGKYDVYLFDVVGSNVYNLTNTASKNELDVSMTADATKIVFSRPINAGLIKIRVCDYNAATNTCTTIGTLGATKDQRQASITGNGNYIALIRDIDPGVLWRVLLYDVDAGTYQIVTTRLEELSHPSASDDGNIVMYLRDRTDAIGKYMIRMKNLTTNVIDNELTKPELGHPHIVSMANYAAYRDISSNNWSRPFTRNIATNARASAHSGDWDYFAPYWQWQGGSNPNSSISGTVTRVSTPTSLASSSGFSPASSKELKNVVSELRKKAQREDSVRVIVTIVERNFRPVGELANLSAIQTQESNIKAAQSRVLSRLDEGNHTGFYMFQTVPMIAAEVNSKGLEQLLAGNDIAAIQEDRLVKATLADSTPLINADDAHAAGFEGTGQVVAVLDTGVEVGHSFFNGRVIEEACYSTTSAIKLLNKNLSGRYRCWWWGLGTNRSWFSNSVLSI